MPLYATAKDLIRTNLVAIANNQRVQTVAIGRLTAEQFASINALKQSQNLPLLENSEIVFIGQHAYNSRVIKDGYSIDDVIVQIESALSVTSLVQDTAKLTAIKNTIARADGYGNEVYDEAIFELMRRKPRAELYSVIPKGDKIKPEKGGVVTKSPTPEKIKAA